MAEIHETTPGYEKILKAFVKSGREKDQCRRITFFILLSSVEDKLYCSPENCQTLRHISDDDWINLVVHASNFLKWSSETDWKLFSELYNKVAQKTYKKSNRS